MNGVFLLALCFSIFLEAIERFFSTPGMVQVVRRAHRLLTIFIRDIAAPPRGVGGISRSGFQHSRLVPFPRYVGNKINFRVSLNPRKSMDMITGTGRIRPTAPLPPHPVFAVAVTAMLTAPREALLRMDESITSRELDPSPTRLSMVTRQLRDNPWYRPRKRSPGRVHLWQSELVVRDRGHLKVMEGQMHPTLPCLPT